MKNYTLYLDESETFDSNNRKYFVIGGVVLENTYHDSIISHKINNLKKEIWANDTGCTSNILHEKDINYANNPHYRKHLDCVEPCYHIFTDNKTTKKLYNNLSKIFTDKNIVTIGVCINKSELWKHYDKINLNHQLSIAIQLLIENYCHFLKANDGIGDICYEDIQDVQNQKIQQRLYEMKALGSMYYSPKSIQTFIKNITFPNKKDNIAGLQLADFVPNNLGRFACKLPPKNRGISKNIRRRLYDGNINNKYKYGLKIIPNE